MCDGPEIVGMSLYLDLRLTVPSGVVLPAAGVTWVAVAPTHRRRGLLREMFEELHRRMVGARYPVAALVASEGGIYRRFGYGPATIEQRLRVERRLGARPARRSRSRRRPSRLPVAVPRRTGRYL